MNALFARYPDALIASGFLTVFPAVVLIVAYRVLRYMEVPRGLATYLSLGITLGLMILLVVANFVRNRLGRKPPDGPA